MDLLRSSFCLAVFLPMMLPLGGVLADVDGKLQAKGWEEFVFKDKRTNHFSAHGDSGIEIVSQSSVSLLQIPVSIDIESQPILRWRWCVTEPVPTTRLSVKGADDRSLAIYVAFPFLAEEATAFERIERKVIEATAGKDAPGRVLMYVWGGDGDRGALVESPYLGTSGMMKILRPARTPSGQWFAESIDIAEDYRQAFGSKAPNPLHIAISADTDDTESTARGVIMNLGFLGSAKVF